jgi:hypothetical protein
MELAPHEKDIARKVAGRLQMAEEAFFTLLTRAKQEGELAKGKDPRTSSLGHDDAGTIVMIKAGVGKRVKQTARRLFFD